MLRELHVKNFAIIDDVKIDFGKGLNILSGETGAGKTLIIEAINLLTGERADSGLIREGKEKLLVQGFFDFKSNERAKDFLIRNNIIDEIDFDTDIVISRELNRTGKNKAFINGLVVCGTNPKAILYYAALLPQFVLPYSDKNTQMVILAATSVIIAALVLGFYTVLAAKVRYWFNSKKYWKTQNRLAGILMIGAGIALSLVSK